jgi:hypothetical protein
MYSKKRFELIFFHSQHKVSNFLFIEGRKNEIHHSLESSRILRNSLLPYEKNFPIRRLKTNSQIQFPIKEVYDIFHK